MFDNPAIAMGDLEGFGLDDGDLMISQIDNAIGVANQGRCITGEEMLMVADADNQWAAEPSRENGIRPLAKNNGESIGTAQLRDRVLNRVDRGLNFV